LAVEAGAFAEAAVRDQAEKAGLLGVVYQSVNLWLPKQTDEPGIAQIGGDLLLVGTETALRAAIDRSLSTSVAKRNQTLAERMSHISGTPDLWVVAAKLPDPLADLLAPIDAAGAGFSGQISLDHGFTLHASFDAFSAESATLFSHDWPERLVPVDASGQDLRIGTKEAQVTIDLQAPVAPSRMIELAVAPQGSGAPGDSASEYRFEVTHTESVQPRIIRIFNLEEGTREILLRTVH